MILFGRMAEFIANAPSNEVLPLIPFPAIVVIVPEHIDEPITELVPNGHGIQSLKPVWGPKEPIGHCEQLDELAAEYEPIGQTVHDDAPALEYVPGGHI
jgi:hypothetical protein